MNLQEWIKLSALWTALFAAADLKAQGTVNFSNFVPPYIDAPAFNFIEGIPRLTGPEYVAQLYAGPDASSLAPVGAPVEFFTGAGAGYFAGGTRVIDSVPPGGDAVIQVKTWDTTTGSTWESALIRCASDIFAVTTGGGGEPPTLPGDLHGLTDFGCLPEPSTVALAILGAGALFVIRRRKQ